MKERKLSKEYGGFSLDLLPLPVLANVSEYEKFRRWKEEGKVYLEKMFSGLCMQVRIAELEAEQADLKAKINAKSGARITQFEKEINDLESQLREMTGKWQSAIEENTRLRDKVEVLGRHRPVTNSHLAVPRKPV